MDTNTQIPPDHPTQQTQQSQQPQPMTQAPMYASQPAFSAVVPSSKSKSTMIIILSSILILLLAGFAAAYLLLLSPSVQAKKASTAFMTAAVDGDGDKLVKLDGDDEAKDFLQNVAQSLKGDSYKLIDKTSESKVWYFLYEVNGANSKYARTSVEKQNGKWVVTSIFHGTEKLKLVPSSSEDAAQSTPSPSPATNSTSPTPSTASASNQTCLSQEDYRYFEFDKSVPTVNYVAKDSTGFVAVMGSAMFFNADSAQENTDFAGDTYDDWADFANKNTSKAWSFTLKGATFDNGNDSRLDPTSIQLAKDRVAKVKQELLKRGVPESRITIGSNINNADEYLDGSFNDDIFRRVDIFINNPCAESGLAPGAAAGR